MEISRHIVFRQDEAPALAKYLNQAGISFTSGTICSLDILESSPHWSYVASCVEHRIAHNSVTQTLFSKEELNSAEWLQVRSKWCYGYPQPEGTFNDETFTYNRESFCRKCGVGLIQKNPFLIKNPPKWGKRFFTQLNWIEDELFTNSVGKTLFETSSLSGVRFRDVLSFTNKTICDGIYQLDITSLLSPSVVEQQRYVDNVQKCPCCGSYKYHPTGIGMLALYHDALREAPDIVKTAEYFGWGSGASHIILVRNSVYRSIMDKHIEKSLIFEPILLV